MSWEVGAASEMQELVSQALKGIPLGFEWAVDEVVVLIKPEDILKACQVAKEDERLDFDYLRCLSAVDYPEAFQVVYHLYSTRKRHKLVFKVNLPRDDPVIASVTPVWRGADWHEREAAEMFGLNFLGHPHLVLLLLEEGLEEHPLLKSHPLVELRGLRDG